MSGKKNIKQMQFLFCKDITHSRSAIKHSAVDLAVGGSKGICPCENKPAMMTRFPK